MILEPAWRRPDMTVMCAWEGDRGRRDPHLDCDGMFCACPCHAARDHRRWLWIRRFYLEANPRAYVKVPVGVL